MVTCLRAFSRVRRRLHVFVLTSRLARAIILVLVSRHSISQFRYIKILTISIDVIRIKSYVDSLLSPTIVPVWVTIYKINLV